MDDGLRCPLCHTGLAGRAIVICGMMVVPCKCVGGYSIAIGLWLGWGAILGWNLAVAGDQAAFDQSASSR